MSKKGRHTGENLPALDLMRSLSPEYPLYLQTQLCIISIISHILDKNLDIHKKNSLQSGKKSKRHKQESKKTAI